MNSVMFIFSRTSLMCPESEGTVSISQPAAFDAIMKRTATATGATANGLSQQHVATRAGYRIQVFDDNNPRTARAQAQALLCRMLSVSAYVSVAAA